MIFRRYALHTRSGSHRTLRAAGQPVRLIQVRDAGHGGPTLFTPEVTEAVALFLRHALANG